MRSAQDVSTSAAPDSRVQLTAERIAWHRAQFTQPKRSTVKLCDFVTRVLAGEDAPTTALDVGAGAGANMRHLAQALPDAAWTGVELETKLVAAGAELLDPARFHLLAGDLFQLQRDLAGERFDVSFSIQVLSMLDGYERALEQMLAVTKRWVFILSLFSDTDLDAFTRLRGRRDGHSSGLHVAYNVYSLPRFTEFCTELGAREVIAERFDIDVDLPRPEHKGIGTWTRQTTDGERLQISGPLLMPWWFVAVRL
jgi:ubiquinone/menaquinone biosynthesis C-methylase UbiE